MKRRFRFPVLASLEIKVVFLRLSHMKLRAIVKCSTWCNARWDGNESKKKQATTIQLWHEDPGIIYILYQNYAKCQYRYLETIKAEGGHENAHIILQPGRLSSAFPIVRFPMEKLEYRPPWFALQVIGIAGASASGKTSVAKALVKKLNVRLVSPRYWCSGTVGRSSLYRFFL